MDLCKIGIHDWQDLVKPMTDFQISVDLREEVYQGGCFIKHHKKICLKCGKYVDNLSKHIDRIRSRINKDKQRRLEGRKLLLKKECEE